MGRLRGIDPPPPPLFRRHWGNAPFFLGVTTPTPHKGQYCGALIFSFPGGGGGLPLWESVGMRRGFAPHFGIWTIYYFIQILLGPISKPHIFSMYICIDALFAPPPQIDKIYHYIQILLGPVLNFERRTPTDFDPECPPPPPPPPPRDFLCCRLEQAVQAVEQTVELPLIRYTMTLL